MLPQLQQTLAGRYEIQREIGQGAFAIVYLARDTRHERNVALKVLNADPGSETGELRFIREIRVLAALQHPNILPLHDSGHVEEMLYYVMPYVSGETLRARMTRERQLPVDAVISITREVADALAYAHGQGIIHRDIKPENILLSAGHAIVADFGIARAIDLAGVRQLTRTGGGSPGTPAYMSPEQLLSEKEVDGRTDLYSLGCVVYEMLTGKPPFAGKEGFVRRFTEPAPVPSSVRTDTPAWLDAIITKTVARDADDRFATAADLVRALANPASIGQAAPARTGEHSRVAEQPSIAVMPFANMSADPENEYFSDGITEEILNALASIPALKVASRTSSFALKGKQVGIGDIGRQLNVKTVLEGSVRRAGQKVRITAQLINVSDGYHVWSERYDRDLEDVFAIQDEIARTIADRLKLKLTTAENVALANRQTDDIEAYELYLRGKHCAYRWNITGMAEKSLGYFEAALAKDPGYALAYHGLADAYSLFGLYALVPPATAVDKALRAASKAVELAPNLPEALTSLGWVQLLSWDWKGAESSLLRALQINPRYSQAHNFMGWLFCAFEKREDAATASARGQELDPFSPAANGISALVAYAGHRYDDAIQASERALERDPTSALSLLAISMSYAAQRDFKKAILHAERGVNLSPKVNFLNGILGAVYAMAGDRESAQRILRELVDKSEQTYVAPIIISWIHLQLGDRDSAFEWLSRAFEERSCTFSLGLGSSLYDPIRDDPRFTELATRVGLPAGLTAG
ncbi:MAG TPA: protein kinase [Gemmatimonadaceae bacterium]|nr:protein kinase [Gemmatimonadaceae bacterium]